VFANNSATSIRRLSTGCLLVLISLLLFLLTLPAARVRLVGSELGVAAMGIQALQVLAYALGWWLLTAPDDSPRPGTIRRWPELLMRVWLAAIVALVLADFVGVGYWPIFQWPLLARAEPLAMMVGYAIGLFCVERLARRIPSPRARRRAVKVGVAMIAVLVLTAAGAGLAVAASNDSGGGLLIGLPDPLMLLALGVTLLATLAGVVGTILYCTVLAALRKDLARGPSLA
jgi:hypothetical protein